MSNLIKYNLKLRNAATKDLRLIDELVKSYKFNFDVKHLQSLVVVEDEDGALVAVGSLTTLLEATFVTVPKAPNRYKVAALERLIYYSDTETFRLGYDCYHGFVLENNVKRVLMKSFRFIQVVGENLIRWIR